MKTLLRRCTKLLLVLLALGLLLLLAIRLVFGRDEPATALAQQWDRPVVAVVPDPDNAWLWLIGQGAPEDESPISLARRWIDAYEAHVAQGPSDGRAAALAAAARPALPFDEGDPENVRHSGSVDCPFRDIDCIEWAGTWARRLSDLEARNAVRLSRYASTLAKTRFENAVTPSVLDGEPRIDQKIPRLHLNLIARDLASGKPPEHALGRLEAAAEFWRRAGEQGRTLVPKLIADRMLERCWRLADAALNRLDAAQRRAWAPRLEALWRAPSAEFRDLASEMRWEYTALTQGIDEQLGVGRLPASCRDLEIWDCLHSWGMRQAYAPQGTRNLAAATFDQIANVFAADPHDYDAATQRAGDVLRALHPMLDGDMAHPFRHGNPVGRILVPIAIPAYGRYIEQRHDAEGLRRLFVLKRLAQHHQIAPDAMTDFLAAQPTELRHPFTGEPFDWHPTLQELGHAPRAKEWKRPKLSVSMRPTPAAGVSDCEHPLRVRFRERYTATQTEDLGEALGCAAFGGGSHEPPDSDDHHVIAARFESVEVGADESRALVRVLLRGGDSELRAYERLDLEANGEFAALEPLGHEDSVTLEASAVAVPDLSVVRIEAVDARVVDAARELARIKHLKLRGLEAACADRRVTARFSAVPVDDLLHLLGDACERRLRVVAPGTYSYEPWPPEA